MINCIKRYFKDWELFEKVWLLVFTILIIGLSIYWRDTITGIACSLSGIWCVVLVAKGKISNYWIGIVNIILYAIISYGNKYYGEVMLNAFYFLPMQFVGAYVWIKNKKPNTKDGIIVKTLTNKNRVIWVIVSILGVMAYGKVLELLGGNLPYVDSMSTVLSIMAMLLMVYRFIEQWILWIIIDIVTIILWFIAMMKGGNDISILLMWTAYFFNAIYGMYNWIKMYKLQEA